MRLCLILLLVSECYCLLLHEITTSPPPTNSILTDKHYILLLDLQAEEKQLRQQLQRTVIQQEDDLKNITRLLSQIQLDGTAILRLITLRNLVNVATGKRAVQSSDDYNDPASNAADGSLDTFSHTKSQENPWWRLDLNGTYNIARVEIYNRIEYGERLHSIRVSIGKTESNTVLCGHFEGPGANGQHIILQCPVSLNGRYVNIMIYKPGGQDILSLAEVRVYAKL